VLLDREKRVDAARLQRRDRLRPQAAVLEAQALVREVAVDLDDLLVLGLEDRRQGRAAGLVGEHGLVGVGAGALAELAAVSAALVVIERGARGEEELGGLLLGRGGSVLGDLDLRRGEGERVLISVFFSEKRR
jgi:hypothetical protein